MRVLILGGYGLIGSHVSARLVAAGCEVVGLARDTRATRRFPRVRWVKGDLARITSPDAWAKLLHNIDAVVNCAGALQDNPRDSLSRVHVEGPAALYKACEARGVWRVVHVSAAGLADADTAFARTKLESERALMSTNLDWVILRPGLVLAPGAYGGTALVRGLAGFPFVTPMVGADSTVQVVSVGDVAEAVVRALAPDAPSHATWELVHPDKLTLGELVRAYRAWLGFRPARLIRIPRFVGRSAAMFADVLAWLGWRSPLRTTSIKQLEAGVTGDPTTWIVATSMSPRSLADILVEHPSSIAERWFARLYFLKPLGLFATSVFWLFSGIVALGPGFDAAQQLLMTGGMNASAARWTTLIGGIADIVLGTAVAFRRLARPTLIAMILLCVGYLVSGSILHPELWLNPLGVYAKVVPIMLAMALLAAIMDER